MPKPSRNSRQHAGSLIDNFGTDAITWQKNNIGFQETDRRGERGFSGIKRNSSVRRQFSRSELVRELVDPNTTDTTDSFGPASLDQSVGSHLNRWYSVIPLHGLSSPPWHSRRGFDSRSLELPRCCNRLPTHLRLLRPSLSLHNRSPSTRESCTSSMVNTSRVLSVSNLTSVVVFRSLEFKRTSLV